MILGVWDQMLFGDWDLNEIIADKHYRRGAGPLQDHRAWVPTTPTSATSSASAWHVCTAQLISLSSGSALVEGPTLFFISFDLLPREGQHMSKVVPQSIQRSSASYAPRASSSQVVVDLSASGLHCAFPIRRIQLDRFDRSLRRPQLQCLRASTLDVKATRKTFLALSETFQVGDIPPWSTRG